MSILASLGRIGSGKDEGQKIGIADEGTDSTLRKDQSFQHIRTRFLVRSK
jgi:hypothetical protein